MGSQGQKGLSRWVSPPAPCRMAEGGGVASCLAHPLQGWASWPPGVLAGGRPLFLTDMSEWG